MQDFKNASSHLGLGEEKNGVRNSNHVSFIPQGSKAPSLSPKFCSKASGCNLVRACFEAVLESAIFGRYFAICSQAQMLGGTNFGGTLLQIPAVFGIVTLLFEQRVDMPQKGVDLPQCQPLRNNRPLILKEGVPSPFFSEDSCLPEPPLD